MSSSSSSSGVGGNVGGTLIPLQRELEATAWAQINKQALGIVRDSIEQVFTQANPRYNASVMGYHGYRTTAENPLLDHSLEKLRVQQSSEGLSDESWTGQYQELKNSLPLEMQQELDNSLKLPLEQRPYTMVALENALILGGQFLNALESLGTVSDPSSVVAKRTAAMILLPFSSLQGSLTNMMESSLEIKETLDSLGHNYPDFEKFTTLLNEIAFPVEVLQNVTRRIDSNFTGQLTQAARQEAALAAEIFGKLADQLDHVESSGALKMLNIELRSLETVALALSLPSTSMAPLFLSLAFATIGFNLSDSSTGVMGPDLALAKDIPNYLLSQLMPNAPRATDILLTNLTTVTIALAIGLSSLAVYEGFGTYPQNDATSTATAKFFAFEIVLNMLASSKLLDTYYSSLVSSAGVSESAAKDICPILSELTQALIILSAVRYGHQSIDQLISQFPDLKEALSQAAVVIDQDTTTSSDNKTSISIAVDELLAALDKSEPEKIPEILDTLLNRLGSSLDKLNENIDTVRAQAHAAAVHMGVSSEDSVTEIVTVA